MKPSATQLSIRPRANTWPPSRQNRKTTRLFLMPKDTKLNTKDTQPLVPYMGELQPIQFIALNFHLLPAETLRAALLFLSAAELCTLTVVSRKIRNLIMRLQSAGQVNTFRLTISQLIINTGAHQISTSAVPSNGSYCIVGLNRVLDRHIIMYRISSTSPTLQQIYRIDHPSNITSVNCSNNGRLIGINSNNALNIYQSEYRIGYINDDHTNLDAWLEITPRIRILHFMRQDGTQSQLNIGNWAALDNAITHAQQHLQDLADAARIFLNEHTDVAVAKEIRHPQFILIYEARHSIARSSDDSYVVTFSADSTRFAYNMYNRVFVGHVATVPRTITIDSEDNVTSIAFPADQDLIAIGTHDGNFLIHRIDDCDDERLSKHIRSSVVTVACINTESANVEQHLTICVWKNGAIRVWDHNYAVYRTYNSSHHISAVGISSKGFMLLGLTNRVIQLWDIHSGITFNLGSGPSQVTTITIMPDGLTAVIGFTNHTIVHVGLIPINRIY